MFGTPSPEQRRRAQRVADDLGKLQKAEEKAPSLDDLKAELGPALTATVDDQGRVSGRIEGHDAVFRAWEMQKAHHLAKAEVAEEMGSRVERVEMRYPDGSKHVVPAQREDELARRKGARRRGATFGYSRAFSEAPYWDER